MKNKKLFAILTLVCFLFTLMPFAAFAAVNGISEVKVSGPSSIDLYFDTEVTTGSAVTDNFTVRTNGGEKNVLSFAKAGFNVIRLTLASPLATAGTVDVDYAPTPSFFLGDGSGNQIPASSGTAKIAAPTVSGVTVNTSAKEVSIIFNENVIGAVIGDYAVSVNGTLLAGPSTATIAGGNTVVLGNGAWSMKGGDTVNVTYTAGSLKDAANVVNVASFSRTVTAPIAGEGKADANTSRVYTVKDNPTITIDATSGFVKTDITYTLKDNAKYAVDEPMYFWFTEADSSNKATTAVVAVTGAEKVANTVGPVTQRFDYNHDGVSELNTVIAAANRIKTEDVGILNNVWYTTAPANNGKLTVTFSRAGVYTLHAATYTDMQAAATGGKSEANILSGVTKITTVSTNNKVTVKSTDESATKYRLVDVSADPNGQTYLNGESVAHAKTFSKTLNIVANNVATTTLKFRLENSKGEEVIGNTVKLETNSANLVLSKETVTTNALGEFSVDVSGKLEGEYKIYITSGAYSCTINVKIGATTPAYITVAKEPTAPIDRDNQSFAKKIRFAITDINGNSINVDDIIAASASSAIAKTSDLGQLAFVQSPDDAAAPYVSIVSQPSASTLENENVYLISDKQGQYATLYFSSPVTAEGNYEIKVALDNGNYATVKFTVKEFTTPVSINLVYAAPSVELGGVLDIDTLEYVDANGVTKDCTNYVDLAATGYAVQSFGVYGPTLPVPNPNNLTPTSRIAGRIVAKSDEKYVGSTITVTAVDQRYNLTTSVNINVADAASGLSFSSKTAQVNVNNQITVSLVDSNGNRVALGGSGTGKQADISYVVMEKPEGAIVSATTAGIDNNLLTAGTFKMNLVSNKIGNVKVQVIAKITNRDVSTDTNQAVTKYYTGVQTFRSICQGHSADFSNLFIRRSYPA